MDENTNVGLENQNSPSWWDGKRIDEIGFAVEFLKENQLRCYKDSLYDRNGIVDDDTSIRNAIYRAIRPFVRSNVAARVGQLLAAVKAESSSSELNDEDYFMINVQNGTLDAAGNFSDEMKFCRSRLNVRYDPNAAPPMKFLRFMFDLFEEDDIPTVQEYLGYCLLPTNKAQKMLIVIGRGGEGKSTLGSVILKMFGESATNGSIYGLESSRFNTANLEHKLLMIDDDLQLSSLPSTSKLKTLVTADTPILVERKGIQPHLADLKCRLIGFGNSTLESLDDTSVGFFRRQIIIRTKQCERKVNDPYLADDMCRELEGILLWMLEGLQRLMLNNYRFTISDTTNQNLTEAMLEANNIPDFIHSNYIMQDHYGAVAASDLYNMYQGWCNANGEDPLIRKKFVKFLKESGSRFGMTYAKNIQINGREVRGFTGICFRK